MNLAAIPSPTTAAWYIDFFSWSIPIRAYALCIVAGIVAACAVTEVRMRRRGAPPWAVLDIAVWAVPFGIVGARIYHVLSSPSAYFGPGGDLANIPMIWKGGLGIWGAVAGGALGAWIAARQMGMSLTFVADALAPGLPLAQAIGRLGNWFNNELYGRPTDLPWGLKIYRVNPDTGRADTAAGSPEALPGLYHPTFLYELLWNLGVALLVWRLDRRYRFGMGRAFALYVMAYTAGRAWIEAMRDDPAVEVLGLRLNVWTSFVVFLGALVYFLRTRGPQEYAIPEGDRFRMVTEEQFAARLAGDPPAEGEDTAGMAGMAEGADPTVADRPPAAEPERTDEADTGRPAAEPERTDEADTGRPAATDDGATEPERVEARSRDDG